ncbi:Iron-sulfur_cluster assembly protein CIA2 [Hexamita inflata]|uniref:Iron-sulfur cluster assembly protein CIA2 n=1 Tax=Hexamita inflata TaxID=28002 RepID=A0AA86P412_9EUKA|nr:Iron-sulfur cluster assembly protein CIA2 [Hexamita inflata]
MLQAKHTVDARAQTHSAQYEQMTNEEIYKWVRLIRDPEHPSMTLEDLKVVNRECVKVDDLQNTVEITFIPTTPNCSMGAVIGLAIKVLLMRILPLRFYINVRCKENAHETWKSLNKQINDKERVLAAMSNENVMRVIEQSIAIEQYVD